MNDQEITRSEWQPLKRVQSTSAIFTLDMQEVPSCQRRP